MCANHSESDYYKNATKEDLIDEIYQIRQDLVSNSQLRLSHTHCKWFLDTIPDLLFKYDHKGNCLDCSGSPQALHQHLPLDIIGKNVREFLPKAIAEKIITTLELAHTTKTAQRINYELTVNEQITYFEGRVSICPTSNEFLLIVRDITELKAAALKNDRSSRLNFAGELASTLGHEIRNPLTTVRGFLQFMLRKSELKNWHNQIELMIVEIDYANKIITQFLALTQVSGIIPQRHGLEEIIAKLKD